MLIQELKDFARERGFKEVPCKCGNPSAGKPCSKCEGFGAYYLKYGIKYSYLWIETRRKLEGERHDND